MKLFSYTTAGNPKHLFGILKGEIIYNLIGCANANSIIELISTDNWQELATKFMDENPSNTHNLSAITLLSPIPKPTSFRDAYAFRQHVATSRKNRGVDMIPEFDAFPVFYFSNHKNKLLAIWTCATIKMNENTSSNRHHIFFWFLGILSPIGPHWIQDGTPAQYVQ